MGGAGGSTVRLLHQDPSLGLLRLRLETPSDLWRIARLVRPGDRVGASTTRRDPEAPESTRAAERDRRRVFLVVRAEQVEFHGFGEPHVRISGPILEGPFDHGRHHTLDLAEGSEVTVTKEALSGGERALLEEGLAHRGEPILLVAAVDWGESTVVRLSGRVVQPVAELARTLPGKRFGGAGAETARADYREEVVRFLARLAPEAAAVILAGPGFFKEQVAQGLGELDPGQKGKIHIVATAESGSAGIHELLRSGRASEVLRGSVAAEEEDLVEQLVRALGGGRRAAVGAAEVVRAQEVGAVETLLVAEDRLADPGIRRLLDAARAARARLFIVSTHGEAGHRLAGLGGIAALLRFDWSPPERGSRAEPPGGPAAPAAPP